MQFENVTALAKANVYFDGKVISHTILLADGSKKTLGIIFPGTFHFDTDAAERMEIVDGACKVQIEGAVSDLELTAGGSFDVPANSGFDITVESSCQYVCSFLG